MASEATPGEATPDKATPDGAGTGAVSEQEDVKRRFREALERKNHRHADGAAAGDAGEHSKVGSAHGPAHTQRQFRRKSGG